MTTENTLTALVGWLISAIFKYIPVISTWFNKLDGLWKRLIIIGFSLIASLAVFGLKCWGVNLPILEPCNQSGLLTFANIALTVAINTQAAYLLLPEHEPNGTP